MDLDENTHFPIPSDYSVAVNTHTVNQRDTN